MASKFLTPTAVTRAVATVLHQKGKFLNRINRQYDAQQPDGRKAGGSITIRMPNEYTVRKTTTMVAQDTNETSEVLTIAKPYGVDMNFTDSELALSLEDFTKRIIEPAVKVLVSNIEADFITDAVNSVANLVDNDGYDITFKNVMQAKQKLIENLAPDDDSDLTLLLSPTHNTVLVDSLKGLFVPSTVLSEQYKSGMFLPAAGVGAVGVSTHLTDHLTGSALKTTTYQFNASGSKTGADGYITVKTGATTFKAGDVITIADVYAVHPETKASLGYLKQFVVVADYAGGAGDLQISTGIGGNPYLVSTGARKNVSAMPAADAAITKVGAGANDYLTSSMYFNRDFYAVAFADLENPGRYGAWADVQTVDGISCRVWRQGDIVNGKFPCRIDVLCGGKAIRPQLASRIHAGV